MFRGVTGSSVHMGEIARLSKHRLSQIAKLFHQPHAPHGTFRVHREFTAMRCPDPACCSTSVSPSARTDHSRGVPGDQPAPCFRNRDSASARVRRNAMFPPAQSSTRSLPRAWTQLANSREWFVSAKPHSHERPGRPGIELRAKINMRANVFRAAIVVS